MEAVNCLWNTAPHLFFATFSGCMELTKIFSTVTFGMTSASEKIYVIEPAIKRHFLKLIG